MSDIAILREMIQQKAIVTLEDYKDKKKAILEEKEATPSVNKKISKKANYAVDVLGLPDEDDVIVIKVDNFKSPSNIFNGTKGECKRADFVIVADIKPRKIIIFIELKAGNPDTKEIVEQFKGAECFIQYCQAIGRSFWNESGFLHGYESRFVAIIEICNSIQKRPTYDRQSKGNHNSPDRMKKIPYHKSIYFKEFI